ncbi:hypothetical protein ACLOJK_003601 [Asimina triloba]
MKDDDDVNLDLVAVNVDERIMNVLNLSGGNENTQYGAGSVEIHIQNFHGNPSAADGAFDPVLAKHAAETLLAFND